MGRESTLHFLSLKGLQTFPKIDVGYASAIKYEITAGNGSLIFQNTGTKKVWFGDNNLSPTTLRGNFIVPTQSFSVDRCNEDFEIWFQCAGTDTSTVSPIEGIIK